MNSCPAVAHSIKDRRSHDCYAHSFYWRTGRHSREGTRSPFLGIYLPLTSQISSDVQLDPYPFLRTGAASSGQMSRLNDRMIECETDLRGRILSGFDEADRLAGMIQQCNTTEVSGRIPRHSSISDGENYIRIDCGTKCFGLDRIRRIDDDFVHALAVGSVGGLFEGLGVVPFHYVAFVEDETALGPEAFVTGPVREYGRAITNSAEKSSGAHEQCNKQKSLL